VTTQQLPSTSSLECRDIRHMWERASEEVLEKAKGRALFARILVCTRCGCLRQDEYVVTSLRVEKIRTKYKYPQGYIVPGGFSTEAARVYLFSQYLK
jgi:hypothetical protein